MCFVTTLLIYRFWYFEFFFNMLIVFNAKYVIRLYEVYISVATLLWWNKRME